AHPQADEGIAVREPLRPREEHGIKLDRVGGRVAPEWLSRAEAAIAIADVVAGLRLGERDLIDRGKRALRPAGAVVEDQKRARARTSRGNPVGAVREEKALVGRRPAPVSPRISPAVQKIAPLPAAAAGMSRGLRRRCAVINDPDLAERVD